MPQITDAYLDDKASNDGILMEADKRARAELETFLKRAGFESVAFR